MDLGTGRIGFRAPRTQVARMFHRLRIILRRMDRVVTERTRVKQLVELHLRARE